MNLATLTTCDLMELLSDAVLTETYGTSAQAAGLGGNVYVTEVYPFGNAFVYYLGDITYRRSYSIDDQGVITLGTDASEVERRTVWEPVDVEFSAKPEYAEWKGEIFRAGDYPDKGVSFTEADIDLIAKNFKPVPLKIEHTDTPLDAVLKDFGLVEVHAEGGVLFGTIRVPTWLHEGFKETVRKVSVGFDETLRRLKEVSLVNYPRVGTARVYAAKIAAAFCATTEFAGKRNSKTDAARIQAIHDLALELGAEPATSGKDKTPAMSGSKEQTMKTIKERLLAIKPEALAEVGLNVQELSGLSFSEPEPELPPQFKAQLDANQKQIAALQAGQIAQSANSFYDQALAAAKVTPAVKAEVITLFGAALKADGQNGAVSFSESGSPTEGEAVKALRKLIDETKPQFRVGESLAAGDPTKTEVSGTFSFTKEDVKKELGK